MASKKYKLATLDFETDPFLFGRVPFPFACGIYTGDDYISFWGDNCAALAAEYLADNKLKVYAHNGGKFDFFYLLDYLEPQLKLINGRIAKCTIGLSKLFDSYLILPLPLSAYKKDDIDYAIFEESERNKTENKLKIQNYLQTDCIYLYEWVSKFIGRFGSKLTLAGAAFDQLELTGYPCKQKSPEDYDSIFRQFYYGGRTQAFKSGHIKGKHKIVDLNSAYPAEMLKPHPFGTHYLYNGNATKLPETGPYFAVIDAVSLGCLPYAVMGENKAGEMVRKEVFYPTNNETREYFATSWEIEAGIDTGTLKVIRVKETYEHAEKKSFKNYVEKFSAEKIEGKQKGDKDLETFAKFMLNASYGKFGADGRKYKQYFLTETGDTPLTEDDLQLCIDLGITIGEYLLAEKWENMGDLPFNKTVWRKPDPQEDFYNVAVAASITGAVRANLWRSICNSENVLYCDTDSIICSDFFGEINPTKLGAWDLEGITTKEGIYIGGKKLYCCAIESEAKKLSKKALEEILDSTDKHDAIKKANKGSRLSFNAIKKLVLTGKEIEWRNDAPCFSLTGMGVPSATLRGDLGARFVKRNIKVTI